MVGFFFFNDTATTEIYTLSLHDALPISAAADLRREEGAQEDRAGREGHHLRQRRPVDQAGREHAPHDQRHGRSEEHTSELQSRQYLVCRLLLEKKNRTGLVPSISAGRCS